MICILRRSKQPPHSRGNGRYRSKLGVLDLRAPDIPQCILPGTWATLGHTNIQVIRAPGPREAALCHRFVLSWEGESIYYERRVTAGHLRSARPHTGPRPVVVVCGTTAGDRKPTLTTEFCALGGGVSGLPALAHHAHTFTFLRESAIWGFTVMGWRAHPALAHHAHTFTSSVSRQFEFHSLRLESTPPGDGPSGLSCVTSASSSGA